MTPRSIMLLLCLTLVSCGGGQTATDSTKAAGPAGSDTQAIQPLPGKPGTPPAQAEEYPVIEQRDVPARNIGRSKPLPGGEFDAVAAMRALLPGRYYTFVQLEDTLRLVAWKCRDCHTQQFQGWQGEDPAPFPFEDGNITMCPNKQPAHIYTDAAGQTHALLVLSTIPQQDADAFYCGRFNCAVLGLALYTLREGQWALDCFSPGLGCYGAFQGLPYVYLLQTGPLSYGCYLVSGNGGAGAPYLYDLSVFGIENGRFKRLLLVNNVIRSNTGEGDWDMTLRADTTGTAPYDLQLRLKGKYNKSTFDVWGDEPLPAIPTEIASRIAKSDSFSFEVNRRYKFANGAYREERGAKQ